MTHHAPPAHLQSLLAAEPDLVDRIFDYLLAEFPQLGGPEFTETKQAVRREFSGEMVFIRGRSRSDLVRDILALFDGRNATEVARRLNVSRATVYRVLKQAGRAGPPGSG